MSKTKLNDDSTIIAIAAVALAALALLITAMKLLHTSIAKVMRDTVSSRSGQSYLGGTRALFGKKGIKGDKRYRGTKYGVDAIPLFVISSFDHNKAWLPHTVRDGLGVVVRCQSNSFDKPT